MITKERLEKLPVWLRKAYFFLKRNHIPARAVYYVVSIGATCWFLYRVIPKPSRAYYPCMQTAAPLMAGLVTSLLSFIYSVFAWKKMAEVIRQRKAGAAAFLLLTGAVSLFVWDYSIGRNATSANFTIWYKPNTPMGIPRGMHPGRVAWGHNTETAYWNGKDGQWWEEAWNNQAAYDKLMEQTICVLAGTTSPEDAWSGLFNHFNRTKGTAGGYKPGQLITVKINQNNTHAHEDNNRINANPSMVLALLKTLVEDAGVPDSCIIFTDPSRFITDNIYTKCIGVYPNVRFVDHSGGNGREKSTYVDEAIPFSVDNGKVARGIASCFVNADYVINMALLKGHVSQGVTLCAKNFFGSTSIDSDWRKNAHSAGFSQDPEGSFRYSVYPDYMGHKDLGGKTMLFLIDAVYTHKFVDGTPSFRWQMAPFNDNWPCSLLASQDGVAIDAVALDFALAEWPDAPDMMYSDYSLIESALAPNPPSKTLYDPERDGVPLESLGVMEHWNNAVDKKYTGNERKGEGIELIYCNTI